MSAVTSKCEAAGIPFGHSMTTYSNESLAHQMTVFKASGLRVLVSIVMDTSSQDQLAQLMINMEMTTGFALVTPGCSTDMGNRGNQNGKPLLGIIASRALAADSASLTNYLDRVASDCPNSGNTYYNGKTYTNNEFMPYPAIAYDGLIGFAKALDAVINAHGGATACTLAPSSLAFPLKLREQLCSSSFAGISGPVSITQCSTPDFTTAPLVSEQQMRGDRTGMQQKLLIYSEQPEARRGNVIARRRVAEIDTATQTLHMIPGGVLVYLGNVLTAPEAVVNPPTCSAGTFRNEWEECVPCAAGRYSDEEDLTMCSLCPTGRTRFLVALCFAFAYYLSALQCQKITMSLCHGVSGTYSSATGARNCTECPQNAYSNKGALAMSECVCMQGYYKHSFNNTNPCDSCPTVKMRAAAICPGGRVRLLQRRCCHYY